VVYESHGVADVVGAELAGLLGTAARSPSAAKLARLSRRDARVWKHAAAYVTITRALASELASRYGARERVFTVPDGAWLESSPPPVPLADDRARFIVGYAGHLYPWKGVDVLIRALARVEGVHGIIVGGHPAEGDRARVESLARSLGLTPRVSFVGQVPPREVSRHLAGTSVLVLPNTATAISERYTSPLKLFEYLTMGRAIVASDLPAIREILNHGETALLVPAGDHVALASAIERLRGDAALRARLSAAARALAPEYTWDKRAERLEAALEAAVS
jgi:glycosyltransferase involved in cell wall biosynthesis